MKTRPKLNRREKILEAATRLFLSKSVMDTQMKEVARLAKVDQSLIGYYFPSLDSLFAEVIQGRIQIFNSYVLDRVAKQGGDVAKGLKTYVLSFFEWVNENPKEATMLQYFFYLAMLREPFISTNESFRRMGRERLAGYLFQGIAQGHFRLEGKEIDSEEIAQQIQGVILGGLLICCSERGIDPRKYGLAAWQTVRKILHNS